MAFTLKTINCLFIFIERSMFIVRSLALHSTTFYWLDWLPAMPAQEKDKGHKIIAWHQYHLPSCHE